MTSISTFVPTLAKDVASATRARPPAEQDGVFEQDFEVAPPGLAGLNRLAKKLNTLEQGGVIRNWSHSRWKNVDKTRHGILFETAGDLNAARLHILI